MKEIIRGGGNSASANVQAAPVQPPLMQDGSNVMPAAAQSNPPMRMGVAPDQIPISSVIGGGGQPNPYFSSG